MSSSTCRPYTYYKTYIIYIVAKLKTSYPIIFFVYHSEIKCFIPHFVLVIMMPYLFIKKNIHQKMFQASIALKEQKKTRSPPMPCLRGPTHAHAFNFGIPLSLQSAQ